MTRVLFLAAGLAACGCAHHKANQYTYAPPLAAPVYPQPQSAPQPVAYPAVAPPQGMAAPMMALPPAAAAAAPGVATLAGEVPALPDGSCPPCTAGGAVPVVYDGPAQAAPCPPGP